MFNKPRLLTPGPTPLPERVRLALAQDMIHHRKPGFKKILLETETMLQKLFGTEQPVLPLSCSGTGAMTAAVHGLFPPGLPARAKCSLSRTASRRSASLPARWTHGASTASSPAPRRASWSRPAWR